MFSARRATGFHRQAKLFELDLFRRKTFLYMVKPEGQNQFVQCPALNETPESNCTFLYKIILIYSQM